MQNNNTKTIHIFSINGTHKTLCNIDSTGVYDYCWHVYTICDYLTKKQLIISSSYYHILDAYSICSECFNHPRCQLELLKYANDCENTLYTRKKI